MSSGSETPSLDALTAALGDRRARSLAMGGEERVAQQHARHKLTARERIDLLFDAGTFVEFGLLAHQHSMTGAVTEPERTPADGVVTGEGLRRRPPRLLRRLRLHGDGRVDGDGRRAEGRPPAQKSDCSTACR